MARGLGINEISLPGLAAGSGEIDFEEFQSVTKKLFDKGKVTNGEEAGSSTWEEAASGSGWTRVYYPGASFGENSIIYGIPLTGDLEAVGKTEVQAVLMCIPRGPMRSMPACNCGIVTQT